MENSELITNALWYIRAQTGNYELTIEEIAEHAVFATDYFNRIFLAHTGFNVMEYLRFCRLKNAARLLRTTDENVLDIALKNGYETHESFTRAFKKQYGVSPTEYKKKYLKKEALFSEFFNDTVAERLTHEFSALKVADKDEVIDWLLETNAVKYGYTAVCLVVTGGPVLYLGDDFRNGCVWVTEWRDGFECDLIQCDYVIAAEYMKLFSDDRFHVNFHSLHDGAKIEEEFSKFGLEITAIDRILENVYLDEPFALTAPEGIAMRELKYEDIASIEHFMTSKIGEKALRYVNVTKRNLHQRDVLGCEDSSEFCFGIFRSEEMIGYSTGCLQNAHGYKVNNCISTSFLDGCASLELYIYAFKFVTNAVLEKGALPFDDVQTSHTPPEQRDGDFISDDLGYKLSNVICKLKYRVK